MPADRDSLRFLDGLTLAERNETSFCALWADLLEQDKAAFDELLAETITNQQALVQRMGLDHDEAEVLAVTQLLWAAGPRMYLNFLDETNKSRLRNAWDRMDRKRKKPEWAALFRQTLRESARNTRSAWRKYWADYDLRMDGQGLTPPDAVPFEDSDDRQDRSRPKWDSSRGAGIPAEVTLRRHTQMDRDAGLLFPPLKDSPPDSDPSDDGTRLVDLGCDLTTKQRALYRSSAGKLKPHQKTKLYSE